MLKITVPAAEFWDEIHEEFVYKKEQALQLEHSLVSLSKWESKWNKAFLGKQEKTDEEILDYVRCMTLTQNVDPEVYTRLSAENYAAINAYIEAPMTATCLIEDKQTRGNKETVTSELIYYWMISYNIPVEFQKWHLNRPSYGYVMSRTLRLSEEVSVKCGIGTQLSTLPIENALAPRGD